MRVAHFSIFAPNRSGMYMTTKELVLAQRALGLDCAMIDAFHPKESQTDGDLITETYHYADAADLYVLHSHVPDPWFHDATDAGIVVMLHGMPHYSWETEMYLLEGQNTAPFAQLTAYFQEQHRCRRFVTMWSPQMPVWDILDNYQGRVRFVQNGIDLARYTPEGRRKKLPGKPVMLVADQARMCKDPFPMVFGAEWFRSHYESEAQLHIVGMPPIASGNRARDRWEHLLENSGLKRVCASRQGIVNDIEAYCRTADILLTSSPDESRVVKEAIASGCDVVSPFLNTAALTEEWLDFAHLPDPRSRANGLCLPRNQGHQDSYDLIEAERTAPIWQAVNAVDAEVLGEQIAKTWEVRRKDPDGRRKLLAKFAAMRYDMQATARGMIEIYREVFEEAGGNPIIGAPQPEQTAEVPSPTV